MYGHFGTFPDIPGHSRTLWFGGRVGFVTPARFTGCQVRQGPEAEAGHCNQVDRAITMVRRRGRGRKGASVSRSGIVRPEPLSAMGLGEAADWQGKAVHYGEVRVVPDGTREDLRDLLLDPREVDGLAHESGAADLGHNWTEVAVVVAEVMVGDCVSRLKPRNSPTACLVNTSASDNNGPVHSAGAAAPETGASRHRLLGERLLLFWCPDPSHTST